AASESTPSMSTMTARPGTSGSLCHVQCSSTYLTFCEPACEMLATCASATQVGWGRSLLGGLGRQILRLDAVDDGRVGEGGGVAECFVFRDVAQQSPHDLARSRLRQLFGEEDRLRFRDRPDQLADVLAQLVDKGVARLDSPAQDHERRDRLP